MPRSDVQGMAVDPTPGVMLSQSGDNSPYRQLLGATTASSSVKAEAAPHNAQQAAQAGLRADVAAALSSRGSATSGNNGGNRH